MRWICGCLMFALAGASLLANGDMAPSKPEAAVAPDSKVTVQELDRQIRFLKDNIEKYNGMAKFFDQKSGSLQSHDYTGSRDAAAIRDECRGIAQDLEAHLAKLEEQREKMLEQQNAKK